MKIRLTISILLLALAAKWVAAATLEIGIRPTFADQPLVLSEARFENSAGERLSFSRISYLLSGFALERADGSWLELPNQFAWLDAEHGRDSVRLENIPTGSFRSIRFFVGPDEITNTNNPAQYAASHPLNPNLNGLHWNWQGGYIFLAVEGYFQTTNDTEPKAFSYHFARSPNRTRISLNAQLNLTNGLKLQLDLDFGTLLNTPRLLSFAHDGTSTHSRTNDPIAAKLAVNLPGAFRGRQIIAATATATSTATVKPLYLPEKFTPYPFQLSAFFPIPDLPRDNPLLVERVNLGEILFHETALSKNSTLACASCHKHEAALSDPRKYSVGVGQQVGTRNAMPLFNLAWKNSFFWDGRAPSLRTQTLMPIQDHTEMAETLTNVCAKLAATGDTNLAFPLTPALSSREMENRSQRPDITTTASSSTNLGQPAGEPPLPPLPKAEGQGEEKQHINYPQLFQAAFGSPEITPEKVALAIESFVLTLTSFDSKFDRAMLGKEKLTEPEQRGFELFMTEYEPRTGNYGADCFHCHGGPLFTDNQFHNNGLSPDPADLGRFIVTQLNRDKGKFSTPSLRNVALTAPYMHDGNFKTLEDVVAHYDHGVHREPTLDPNIAKHPPEGLRLSRQDQDALVAFLRTLTDKRFTDGK